MMAGIGQKRTPPNMLPNFQRDSIESGELASMLLLQSSRLFHQMS